MSTASPTDSASAARSVTIDPVISATELAAALDAGTDVVIIEVRRDRDTIPGPVAVGLADRPDGHLPGAHAVDFFEFVGPRTETSGHAPLPEEQQLRELIQRLGIHDSTLVAVYSPDLASSATRAWWVLRWAGLGDVRYLDGGVHAWLAAGRELTDVRPEAGAGTATVRIGALPTLDADAAATLARKGHLLDARGVGAYTGSPDDPATGHIPGAHSLPGTENLREDYLESEDVLRERYAPYLTGAPVGAYCGGGVAATLDILALTTLGVTAALYPGSWSQWVTDSTRPVATGTERG